MYERLLNLYLSGRLDEVGLQKAVDRGWITENQKNEIIAQKTTFED